METLVIDKPLSNIKYPLYYSTQTLCPVCNNLVAGKVVARDNRVFIERRCPAHGYFEGLICSDREWYEHLPQFYTEGIKPSNPVNAITRGCPDDCGLCNAHSQMSRARTIPPPGPKGFPHVGP
jgi:uncharacterized radical SAM superfamily Fe-S cluster-containing enzyme